MTDIDEFITRLDEFIEREIAPLEREHPEFFDHYESTAASGLVVLDLAPNVVDHAHGHQRLENRIT